MPTASSKYPAKPTVAQAYSYVQQLAPLQQAELMARLRQDLTARIYAMAVEVQAEMEVDGVFITEADIDTEVQAARAERYARSQQ